MSNRDHFTGNPHPAHIIHTRRLIIKVTYINMLFQRNEIPLPSRHGFTASTAVSSCAYLYLLARHTMCVPLRGKAWRFPLHDNTVLDLAGEAIIIILNPRL
jgi:hypothetical protein